MRSMSKWSVGLFAGVLGLALAASVPAFSHGGGIDSYGGHNDRVSGGYHFHRGPLAGRSYASKAAALRALRAHASPPRTPASGLAPTDASNREKIDQQTIRYATTSKTVKALVDVLLKKKLITKQELATAIRGP